MVVARFHGHARRLFWSALVLIGVAGAVGWFFGRLPDGIELWMLFAAAGALLLFLVVVPWLRWLSRSYTITTRRVIARSGFFSRVSREYPHTRGYTVHVRRGPLQRLWRAGTITLTNGVDRPLVLTNIPDVALVQEVLADQVEVSQILAHRDAVSGTTTTIPS